MTAPEPGFAHLRSLEIPPLTGVAGSVRVPGSKSISNRALLLAGFADGQTVLEGLLHSDDTKVMIDALRRLGARIDVDGDSTRVAGAGARPAVRDASFFLGNAGTAMRPLAAALAVVAATTDARFELHGTARMHERPIADLVNTLRALGCRIDYLGRDGFPPLRVSRGEAELRLDAPIRVRGDVSSQFLTALLLALPLRAGRGEALIEVEGELISRPYVDITIDVLGRFGVAVEREAGGGAFRLRGGQAPRAAARFVVEGDASSASYFIAAGAVAAHGGPFVIEGVGAGSIQGDLAFVDAVRAMGAIVHVGDGRVTVERGRLPLAPAVMDCTAIPDAAMTLAALALFADGRSRLDGIGSWRVKETDRIAAMAAELRKCGAQVTEGADFLEIDPPQAWRAASVATWDDHRMAMAMSLAAFNAAARAETSPSPVPIRIEDPGCVAKTWPGYFDALFAVAQAEPQAVPVLTIDGPTASGKGTLAAAVARALGYRLLDSGAVYRAGALAAAEAGIDAGDEAALAALCARIDLRFGHDGRAWFGGHDVTEDLRQEHVGALASKISSWPRVRATLLGRQLAFRGLPGLVADGRDMGSVVFRDARLKVFLTASAAMRAERRYKQLITKGIPANIDSLRAELEARDARDIHRAASPLKPAEGAFMLDNSALSIEASVDAVLKAWHERGPFETHRGP